MSAKPDISPQDIDGAMRKARTVKPRIPKSGIIADGLVNPNHAPPAAESGRSLACEPVLVCLADVQPQPVTWLWPQRVALGKLTLIAGDPGLGKSFLTMDMASRVSTGAGWPDQPGERFNPGGVVLLSAEDDLADTIRPRLDAAGADVERITALQAVEHRDPGSKAMIRAAFTLADMPALAAAITRMPGCKLVIVDPISAYMGGTDSHVNTEVRAALAPLSELAAKHGVAVVAVTHLRKGEGAAIYRAMGSLAFVAAARAAWAVSKDKDDPTGKRRLLLPVKNNIGNDTTGLAFELRSVSLASGPCAALAWEAQPVTISADDALAPPRHKPGPDADERNAAVDWLRQALADGPQLARDLEEEASEAHSISKATLRRAKDALNVDAYRPQNPGPWWWQLPSVADAQPAHLPTIHPQPEHLAHVPALAENGDFGSGLGGQQGADGADAQVPHDGASWSDGSPVVSPVDDLGAGCSDDPGDEP